MLKGGEYFSLLGGLFPANFLSHFTVAGIGLELPPDFSGLVATIQNLCLNILYILVIGIGRVSDGRMIPNSFFSTVARPLVLCRPSV